MLNRPLARSLFSGLAAIWLVSRLAACGPPEAAGPRDAAVADAPVVNDAALAPDLAPAEVPDGGGGGPCPPGSTLKEDRRACPGAPTAAPAALGTAAAGAVRGEVISLGGLDEGAAPCAQVVVYVPDGAPTMLFSDEPESPAADGVLYADQLAPGAYRAYVYHVNGGGGLRKFPVVLLNQGAAAAHVTLGARGLAGPSTRYVATGKAAARAWLDASGSSALTVPPQTRVLLDAGLDALHAANGELVHAILDFTVDAPVKLSVVSVGATVDATTATAGLSLLPDDGLHTRGTFSGADLIVMGTAPLDAAGVRRLRFGANVTELDLSGHDAVDNKAVALGGNYGVVYHVLFSAGSRTALLLAPRGGDWGGAARITNGVDATGVMATALPSATDSLATVTDAIAAGRFVSPSVAELRLITAGGSNTPIDLVTVPY